MIALWAAAAYRATLQVAQLLRYASTMTAPLTASLEERLDDPTRRRVRESIAASEPSSTSEPHGRIAAFAERVLAKRFGHKLLVKLAVERGHVATTWRDIPNRMHLVANQTKLMLELVDDFRVGTYRKIPWRSLVVAAAAILYAVNPADVLPDVLAGLGILDDIAVAAIAARVLRKDLIEYCQFKGYAVEEYFPR